MKKIYLTLSLLCCISPGFAQQALTLFNMPWIGQSTQVNPSLIPEDKLYVGIPMLGSTSLLFTNSGFTWRDLHRVRTDDSISMEVEYAISKLSDKNFISLSVRSNILEAGYRYGKNYFTFNISEKANFNLTFPKALFDLIFKGNAAFIGQEVTLSRTSFDVTHHREYALGMAREINSKVTVGGKFKYLYGMENFSSAKSNLSFYTAPDDYQLELSSDYIINTSTTGNAKKGSSDNYFFGLKNTGFAIDLGTSYRFNDRWKFQASVIDLGYIKWSSNVKNYVAESGEYKFNGIDINQYMNDEEGSSNVLDSLSNSFGPTENSDPYKTYIPTHIYANALYQINAKSTVSGMLHGQVFRETVQPTITAAYNRKVLNCLAASINYSMINHHFNNVGAGVSVNAGPVQFYLISDNLIGTINPLSNHTLHVNFGINLVFGRPVVQTGKTDFGVQDKNIAPVDAGVEPE
jgi:hypothetical protein